MSIENTEHEELINKEQELNTTDQPDVNSTEQENLSSVGSNQDQPAENESVINWDEKLLEAEDKYLRLYAEFENYKRRTSAERIELFKTANQEVLISLIPVLDDFGRALKSMQIATSIDAVKEGIELVNNKFNGILTAKGLKPMEAIGKEFDVEFHEAITNIPAPTEELKGKVVDEVEKGYFLNDKVIRFAKVVVGE